MNDPSRYGALRRKPGRPAINPAINIGGERPMRLPDRRKKLKMGVRQSIQKIWPRHRRWVKAHGCCVPGCEAGSIDFAHLRSAGNAGAGQRPHDIFGVSLCRAHHDEQHRIAAAAFGRKYKIDLWALAAEFARRSPDWHMRASLKLVETAGLP
jgi:hypothetical protein